MNKKSKASNLLFEPWIPVLWNTGKTGRVGIRKALTQAGPIRRMVAIQGEGKDHEDKC